MSCQQTFVSPVEVVALSKLHDKSRYLADTHNTATLTTSNILVSIKINCNITITKYYQLSTAVEPVKDLKPHEKLPLLPNCRLRVIRHSL